MTYVGPQAFSVNYPKRKVGSRMVGRVGEVAILGIDPGGTTGWSLLRLPTNYFQAKSQDIALGTKVDWLHGQIDCHDEELGTYQLIRLINDWPGTAIVIEDFNIRQRAVDISPARIIGKLRQHLWMTERTWFMQSASQAKTTATDDRLKLWNCYTGFGGLNHARDADRHVILFLRKTLNDKDLREEAWPYVYGR